MNPFRQLLKRSGHQVPVGTWLTSASPLVAEAVGHAGFDWGVVDMEHAPLDLMGVVHLLQALGKWAGRVGIALHLRLWPARGVSPLGWWWPRWWWRDTRHVVIADGVVTPATRHDLRWRRPWLAVDVVGHAGRRHGGLLRRRSSLVEPSGHPCGWHRAWRRRPGCRFSRKRHRWEPCG